jgi:hypothetical protein
MIVRLAWFIGLAVVVVLLWMMPAVLFPHPGANDALALSALGPLLYLLTLIAALLSLGGVALLGWKAEGAVGVGAFVLGVATAFVLAIVTFGNFSNDRFAALFLTPVLGGPVGTALIIGGLVMRSHRRGRPLLGVLRGVVAAIIVALWLQARGANDWLQAPYGFDVYALIASAAIAVLLLSADARRPIPAREQ